MLALPSDLRYLRRNLPSLSTLRLQYAKAPRGRQDVDVADELVALIVDRTFFVGRPPPNSAASFERCIADGDTWDVIIILPLIDIVTQLRKFIFTHPNTFFDRFQTVF